jgi:hypothetical protein
MAGRPGQLFYVWNKHGDIGDPFAQQWDTNIADCISIFDETFVSHTL